MFRPKIPHEAEFRALVERWSGYVRAQLRRIDASSHEGDLQELEQDVRLKLWQQLKVERNWDKPASFIRKVVLSVAIDAARRKQVRGGTEQVDIEQLDLISPDAAVGAQLLEHRTELLGLLAKIEHDSPQTAQAVSLYLQGFTTPEIGTLLGWTEAKARNAIYRLLEELRAQLKEG